MTTRATLTSGEPAIGVRCERCGRESLVVGARTPTEARRLLQRRLSTDRSRCGYRQFAPEGWARVPPLEQWTGTQWAPGVLIDVCGQCFDALNAERIAMQARTPERV